MQENLLKKSWNFYVNKGIDLRLSRFERTIRRIFNIILLLILFTQIFVLIDELTQSDLRGVSIISLLIGFTLFIIYITRQGAFYTAAILLNVILSTVLILLIFLYKDLENIGGIYLVLIYSGILFSKHDYTKVILVSLNIISYFTFKYFDNTLILETRDAMDTNSNLSLFIASTLAIGSMTYFLIQEFISNEKELDLLIEDLEDKNLKLKTSNQDLERFTYLAAHDLRTPMRTIISFLGLAEKKIKNNEYSDIQGYFDIVKEGAAQMNSLIVDSLEYTKVNQEVSYTSDEVNLNNLIAQIKINLELEYGPFQIITPDIPKIRSKESLLFKMMTNIIENGVKYNDKNEKIITIDYSYQNGKVFLSIADNGIGIDPNFFEEIFIIYRRLHNQSVYKGTGLGLAICQKICREMGGDIYVESNQSKGSTFHLSFATDLI